MSTATNNQPSSPVIAATPERALELSTSYKEVSKEISNELTNLGKDEASVQLVAVSKYMPESDIQALYNIGHRHFGENYVQELLRKSESVST